MAEPECIGGALEVCRTCPRLKQTPRSIGRRVIDYIRRTEPSPQAVWSSDVACDGPVPVPFMSLATGGYVERDGRMLMVGTQIQAFGRTCSRLLVEIPEVPAEVSRALSNTECEIYSKETQIEKDVGSVEEWNERQAVYSELLGIESPERSSS